MAFPTFVAVSAPALAAHDLLPHGGQSRAALIGRRQLYGNVEYFVNNLADDP
jgi:hypothetical protein